MKYKVQEHIEKTTEYIVYQVASNGELCKRIASCREKKDADLICTMLGDQDAKVAI